MTVPVTMQWAPNDDTYAASPTWVDLTATGFTRGATTNVGRTSVFDALAAVGAGDLYLQNHEALLNVNDWHRWKQVRISDDDNGVIFHGFIDKIDHDQNLMPFDATAAMRLFDGMAWASRNVLEDGWLAPLTGQTAVAAASYILTDLGGPGAPDVIGASNCRVRFPAVDPASNAPRTLNALTVFQQLMETEAGMICQQPQESPGKFEIRGRYAPLIALAAGPVATFSSQPDPGEIQLQPPFVLSAPSDTYRNRVSCTGPSGVVKVASDIPDGYPTDGLERTLLSLSDNWVQANCDLLLNLHRHTYATPRSITVQMWPHRLDDPTGAIRAAVCALRIGDYIVAKATQTAGSPIESHCFIDHISHTITPQQTWQATLELSSAQPWLDEYGTYDDLLILDTDDWDSGKILAP